jgi:predicted phage terminase large subunit-like protein
VSTNRASPGGELSNALELAALELQLEADILAASFEDFARRFWPAMTGLPFPENAASRALCAAFQAVADGRILRLLVAISPGIGKSTFLALYAAWRRARRPDWRSLHAMTAQADADRESERVRRLVQSEEFQRLWPAVAMGKEQSVRSWTTTALGRYFSLGRDGAITSKRVLEVVIDDPMTALERYSKTIRDEVWTWVDGSVKSRIDGDGPMIIVAQRLDRDDIHARCLASGEHWCLLEPAAERDGRGLELRDHEGKLVWRDDRAPGDLIAPQMLTRAKLAGLSKSVRITQYQQRPDEDEGGGSIARTAWRFHAPEGATGARPRGCDTERSTVVTPASFTRIVISCDPTFGGTKTENDFASTQVWGESGSGRYLLARWKRRAKQREQREQIRRFRAEYPSATILIELAAGGAGMVEELAADSEDNGVKLPALKDVQGVTVGSHTGGKAARLDNVSPTIEQGLAYLPLGMPDLQDFVDELAGATAHDDDQDACSQALHWLNTKKTAQLPVSGAPQVLQRR